MASVASQLIEEVTAHAQSDSLEDAREPCADGIYLSNNLRNIFIKVTLTLNTTHHKSCNQMYCSLNVRVPPGVFVRVKDSQGVCIRDEFKNRLIFINSAPTNTESALRLLSAPSVTFWQQTAICHISLWALVVELHPLSWSRAQAVRRLVTKWQWKSL